MYKSGSSHKARFSASKAPVAVKGLALIFILCVGVRLLSLLGAHAGTERYMTSLFSSDRFLNGVMDFELGGPVRSDLGDDFSALIFNAAVRPPDDTGQTAGAEAAVSVHQQVQQPEQPTDTAEANGSGLYYEIENVPASVSADTPATPAASNEPSAFETPTIISEAAEPVGVCIDNRSSYDVDIAALLNEPLNITLTGDSPAILIIHTHSSEAYMPDGDNQYEASDTYRTQDKQYSVVRVGDELAAGFVQRGIGVIHDRNVYDFPSYQGSYSRSYESIQSYLADYPSIQIVIDLHRDAIHSDDGTVYKTLAQIGDETCAQIMLVMGTDSAGLKHPNWRENLKLGLRLESEMNELYPSLAKPIWLSEHRYNQQATLGSMIVEVGCTGNTLEEAVTAARYFADAASNVIGALHE